MISVRVSGPLLLALLVISGCAESGTDRTGNGPAAGSAKSADTGQNAGPGASAGDSGASGASTSAGATSAARPAAAPSPDGQTSDGRNAGVRRIGFSTLTLTNPFFKVIADTMTVEAQKRGFEIVVVSGEQDVARQTAQVEDFIAQGVAAIVLNPCDSRAIAQAIQKANAAGIPVFTNDIRFDGTEGQVVCHVATDNLQGGRLAGEAMVKLLGESGGKVAVLHYPNVESCQLRVRGFTEVIEAHNASPGAAQISVVTTLDGRGSRDGGFAAARDAIEAQPDLAAVFAINDPSAIGASMAFEAAGRADQVKIVGFDGAAEGKLAILEGRILCDPIQFPDEMGRKTIEVIAQYFDGDDVPTEILIPSSLYYREDAQNDPALKAGTSP